MRLSRTYTAQGVSLLCSLNRILDDESKRAMLPSDFSTEKQPLKHIFLEEQEETSLEELVLLHGSTDVRECARHSQADPHCMLCGGGESEAGNEILLCDGLRCANNYHQQCCEPVVEVVPEGAWLCPTCVTNKNRVDPQVLEDERKAKEALGGTEQIVVLANDGTGVQDIGLLAELLEVINNSLPLIGKTNAAKLVFAPDHESLLIIRSSGSARRVLGGVVIKPHRARGFLEIAFCVVRKEEQRSGVGTRLLSALKEHAVTLGVLHLLTYADDSAHGFFGKNGFDPEPEVGMHINRFHWAISHYIGSQLRQCVLDPDGAVLYPYDHPCRLPPTMARRLYPMRQEAGGIGEGSSAGHVDVSSDGDR